MHGSVENVSRLLEDLLLLAKLRSFCTCVMFHHPVQLDTSDLSVSVPC